MRRYTHTLSSLNTNATMPINTFEPLYYNPINKVSIEFDQYKKQQRKKGVGNRVDHNNWTYIKKETKEEKEMRKREKELQKKGKEERKKEPYLSLYPKKKN